MKSYETLSEAVNDLIKRGYIHNFNLKSDCVECAENGLRLRPDDFDIDEVHRFEGPTDPGDENILFALSSGKQNLKGILISAFGAYSDAASEELIAKLGRH